METFNRMLQEGGAFMIPILILGVIAGIGCLLGLFLSWKTQSRKLTQIFAGAGFLSVLMILGLSWLGYQTYFNRIQQAVQGVERSDHLPLICKGVAEASGNIGLGIWMIIVPFFCSIILLVRGLSIPRRESAPQGGFLPTMVTVLGIFGGLSFGLLGLIDYLGFGDFHLFFWLTF